MNKLFEIAPVISDCGPEPTLFEIIIEYYITHGIDYDRAMGYAVKYREELLDRYIEYLKDDLTDA